MKTKEELDLDQQRAIDDQRLRIYLVPNAAILEMFQQRGDQLAVPIFPELPAGYQVRGVNYDFEYNAIGFLIWSMEFPSIPLGNIIQKMPGAFVMQYEMYHRAKLENE